MPPHTPWNTPAEKKQNKTQIPSSLQSPLMYIYKELKYDDHHKHAKCQIRSWVAIVQAQINKSLLS